METVMIGIYGGVMPDYNLEEIQNNLTETIKKLRITVYSKKKGYVSYKIAYYLLPWE